MNDSELRIAVDRCDDRLYETFARNAELAEEKRKEVLEKMFSNPFKFIDDMYCTKYTADFSTIDNFLTKALKMAYERDYSESAVKNLLDALRKTECIAEESIEAIVETELNLLPY